MRRDVARNKPVNDDDSRRVSRGAEAFRLG